VNAGALSDRIGLERALREAEAGRFDLLLVYRVDRLSRSVRGLAQILERLDAAEVLFRSATEPFDTASSAGRMMVQMLGVFAEFERATIVERTVAGMQRKAERGEWVGGNIPFGYRLGEDRHFLVPELTEAPVIPLLFQRYAERLQGSSALAKWLTERGLRTRQGKPFNVRAVLGMLRNHTYLGEVSFQGTHYPAPHEPLVDKDLFERVQEILGERSEDISLRRSNLRVPAHRAGEVCPLRQALPGCFCQWQRRSLPLLRVLLASALRQEGARGRTIASRSA
jgi:site-specific DNA recombinase